MRKNLTRIDRSSLSKQMEGENQASFTHKMAVNMVLVMVMVMATVLVVVVVVVVVVYVLIHCILMRPEDVSV